MRSRVATCLPPDPSSRKRKLVVPVSLGNVLGLSWFFPRASWLPRMSVDGEVDPEGAGPVEVLEDAAVEPLESEAAVLEAVALEPAVLEQWADGLFEVVGLR